MHPMVGGCVHDRLDGAGQLAYGLGVENGLVDLHHNLGEQHNDWIEAQEHNRQVEEHRPEGIHGAKTVGDGDVEERGRVMDCVRRPGQVHTVHEPMFPIIGKVRQNHADQNSQPVDFNVKNRKLEGIVKRCDVERAQKKICQANKKRERYVVGQRIAYQRPGELFVDRVSDKFKGQKRQREDEEPVIDERFEPFKIARAHGGEEPFHCRFIDYQT